VTQDKYEALKRSMEAALAADPDDLGTHSAYADLLEENSDPRGEFIRVQLALEDESLPARERNRLAKRERELLEAHQREWLGELARFLIDGEVSAYEAAHGGHTEFPVFRTTRPAWLPEEEPFTPPDPIPVTFRFRRGWLDRLHQPRLSLYGARVLRQSPVLSLLRTLTIDEVADSGDPPPDPSDGVPERDHSIGLGPLAQSTVLGNVRHFRLGPAEGFGDRCWIHSRLVVEVLKRMPKLEEMLVYANGFNLNDLFTCRDWPNLRVLQTYHQNQVHRLQLLADNPAMRTLTHLLLHPHNYRAWWQNDNLDDSAGYQYQEGYLPLSVVRPFLRSANFPHLRHLQLRCSSMGDEGCREILHSGILKRLKMLDLRHGCITDAGLRLLLACPDVRNLESLDLGRNALTARAIRQARDAGVPLLGDDQQTAREASGDHPPYLTEGDFE
jgi:uncharacterized protein (TIGR02996 family)